MESLKILTTRKKTKQKKRIYGYPAALIAIVGWLSFPIENKPPNVTLFFNSKTRKGPYGCQP